ncbi:unnamed protein product [Victoria cruziana]
MFPLETRMYSPAFQACTGVPSFINQGKQLHAHMTLHGFRPESVVGARLVAMYASFGYLHLAHLVFNQILSPAVLPFNALIRGYSVFGYPSKSLEIYLQLRREGVRPDNFTFPFALKSCADLNWSITGRCLHQECLKTGFHGDLYVGTSMIDVYVKFGEIEDARQLFDALRLRDVSSWNALIAGYFKCGNIDDATKLFYEMPKRNVISWTAMISGFTQNGLADRALGVFYEMQERSDVKPNWVTIMSILPACGHSSALEQGKQIHNYASTIGLDANASVQTALVAMYAKCGSLIDARCTFNRMHRKDLAAWNTIISAYASHGCGKETIVAFEDMKESRTQPDDITFVSLLSACSHAGLVDEGFAYFDCMSREYGIQPREEHYACMVDLLSRAGRLGEARDLINNMKLEPGPSIWGALLAACRIHGNLEIGKEAASKLFILEPENGGNYVLLSNMYAQVGRWEEVNALRYLFKQQGLKKNPGCSWIEINRTVHVFVGGDRSHQQSQEIYALLKSLSLRMKVVGYVPDTSYVLHDVNEEEKEQTLSTHSEKLAIAFGILNTSPGTAIRVTKNLRICGDCHVASKFISKIYRREIILRDVNRFHIFNDGICSCNDYW